MNKFLTREDAIDTMLWHLLEERETMDRHIRYVEWLKDTFGRRAPEIAAGKEEK